MLNDSKNISIAILGEGGTGKSCITMRLIRGKWVDEYDPTIEDSYTTTRTIDGKEYHLDIIDTAGQEEYREMLGSMFATSNQIDAFVLVYDITSKTSLDNLQYFNDMIEKSVDVAGSRRNPVKMVIGNKCDLAAHREVSAADGLAWAKARSCKFMETSAKQMVNIEESFQTLVRQVANNRISDYSPTKSQVYTSVSAVGEEPKRGLKKALSSAHLRENARRKKAPVEEKKSGCCVIQ